MIGMPTDTKQNFKEIELRLETKIHDMKYDLIK